MATVKEVVKAATIPEAGPTGPASTNQSRRLRLHVKLAFSSCFAIYYSQLQAAKICMSILSKHSSTKTAQPYISLLDSPCGNAIRT
jgi:hypothetical protein